MRSLATTVRPRPGQVLRERTGRRVSDVLAETEQQAVKLGADAVVGVDTDYESVGDNMLMVSASGTAVKLG